MGVPNLKGDPVPRTAARASMDWSKHIRQAGAIVNSPGSLSAIAGCTTQVPRRSIAGLWRIVRLDPYNNLR